MELEKYLERLKQGQAKITNQRIEILKIFLANPTVHLTAEDVMEKLASDQAGIATVYRTLELFCRLGILKKVNYVDNEFAQYDLIDISLPHFHHHLICDVCGKIIEINDDLLGSVEKTVKKRFNFLVKNHELVMNGICEACQKGVKSESI